MSNTAQQNTVKCELSKKIGLTSTLRLSTLVYLVSLFSIFMWLVMWQTLEQEQPQAYVLGLEEDSMLASVANITGGLNFQFNC